MADEPDTTSEALPAVRSLPRGIEPPPGAEAHIIAALRRDGLLSPSRRSRSRPLLALAAGMLLFIAGWALGNLGTQPSTRSDPVGFALLLYGDVSTVDGAEEAALVDEYRRWAMGLRRAGREVSGERLGDAMRIVQTAAPGMTPERVRGFFLISAASLDEAEAIARTCPHARRGGVIVVRSIDAT
jgi:hypothetical protein